MRLLLVEDDAMLGEGLKRSLRRAAYTVDWAQTAQAAQAALRQYEFDLVLLDLGLPGGDGLQVLSLLRSEGMDVPVLIITARDTPTDRVRGLDLGADDYLAKPFDLDELLARVRALLRRRSGRTQPLISHGLLVVNPATRAVSFAGAEVTLGRREYALLLAMLEQPGRVYTREQLIERLYGWEQEVGSNTLEVHVHALRKKLTPEFITCVRGIGYSITQ